ncbi:hypothetical protein EJK15_64555, partial [Nonomuraea basaltis]
MASAGTSRTSTAVTLRRALSVSTPLALGCPRTSEVDVYLNGVWAGRRQTFLRGQMVWSPRQGPKMVV